MTMLKKIVFVVFITTFLKTIRLAEKSLTLPKLSLALFV